ncbi:MAG: hypothetical protein IJW49_10750 [Clostridia bacterium]|nr:hypothetical protein [Clostridia bacterium]
MAKTPSKEDRELSDLLKKLRQVYLEDPAENKKKQDKTTEADRKFQEQLAKMMGAISDPMAEYAEEDAEQTDTSVQAETSTEPKEPNEAVLVEESKEAAAPVKKERKKTDSENKPPKKTKKATASKKTCVKTEIPEKAVAEPEIVSEPEVIAEPEVVTEPEVVAKTEIVSEPEVVNEREIVAEPIAVTEPEMVTEPEEITEPEVIAEPVAITETESVNEPEVVNEPEAVAEPETVAEVKKKIPEKKVFFPQEVKKPIPKKSEAPQKSSKAVHYLPDDLPSDIPPSTVKAEPPIKTAISKEGSSRRSENEPIRIVPKQKEAPASSAQATEIERIVIRPPVSKTAQTERFVIRPRNEKPQQTAKKAEATVLTDAPIKIGKEKVSDESSED